MWQKADLWFSTCVFMAPISFHRKNGIRCRKALESGMWTSELLSSNHKEDMVSKEN